jgi:hypothetical protein
VRALRRAPRDSDLHLRGVTVGDPMLVWASVAVLVMAGAVGWIALPLLDWLASMADRE